MPRKVLLILIMFSLFLGTNVYAYGYRETNESTGYKVVIEDDQNILTMSDVSNLKRKMLPLTKYGNIMFKTTNDTYTEIEEYSKNSYYSNFQETNGIIIVYFSSRDQVFIYREKDMKNIISQEEANNISKDILYYEIGRTKYQAIEQGINKISKILRKDEPVEVYNYQNEETSYELSIEDDARLLSKEEVEKLSKEMKKLTKHGNIAFKSIDYNETTTSSYARDYYHKKFSTSSGTLFLIDMYNREIYIFSDGNNYSIITSSKANIIADNIYRYASREEYYNCASEAYKEMYTLLEGGKITEPMRHISNFLISIIIAFLLNFLIVVKLTKIQKAKSDEILRNCDVSVLINNITGRITGTHEVYSPIESSSDGSSSGSSSGGGGGGGSSSGGGGGHSF